MENKSFFKNLSKMSNIYIIVGPGKYINKNKEKIISKVTDI